ncbi:hypothetical protein SteCoe_36016 [Stentor coeruleus]|uniref:Uncharacterized protein n=1 Tax=Stentor coeruleus TaxID=5963 RepID=A0A1R2ARA2_9CILI|nr:hypothetical protein SteCoe_36016 [Stentor coeruleus]
MRRILLWAGVAGCSGGIFYFKDEYLDAYFQGALLFIINYKFTLNKLQGRLYRVALILELFLSLVSIYIYMCNQTLSFIFWVYFCSVNKFAVENPDILDFSAKCMIYLLYASSAVILGLYMHYKNDILLRYGLIGAFLNMDLVCCNLIYKAREGQFDLKRFSIAFSFGLGLLIAMIDPSRKVVLPAILVTLGCFFYDIYKYIKNS